MLSQMQLAHEGSQVPHSDAGATSPPAACFRVLSDSKRSVILFSVSFLALFFIAFLPVAFVGSRFLKLRGCSMLLYARPGISQVATDRAGSSHA